MKCRTLLATVAMLAVGAVLTAAHADDKSPQMPEVLRGTWLLRLTSDDGGKTYKAGDGKAVCEVSEAEIKFAKKVDFAAEKLVLKSVTKLEGRRAATYTLTFEGGEVWTVSQYPESITALIQKDEKGDLTETYRITVRKQ